MKSINYKLLILFVLLMNITVWSQKVSDSEFGNIEPFKLEITFEKTSHIIFPSAIRYVDLGSDNIIAGKAPEAENVLRIKSNVHFFEPETNFTVITEDGQFYNFDVVYSESPETLNLDITGELLEQKKNLHQDVLFEDMSGTSVSVSQMIMEAIIERNKRNIKHIGSKIFGIQSQLKGIYIHDGKYYLHTEIHNQTKVPFHIDFISFNIVDKKIAKRSVVQEKVIKPLRIFDSQAEISGNSSLDNVFLLEGFTISNDKEFRIQIFEEGGSRHQVLYIENSDLLKAKLIKDMHIKI